MSMSTSNDPRDGRTCDLTDKPIINDCVVRVEFGYNSDLNGRVYHLCVHDDTGKQILQHINTLFTNNKCVDGHFIQQPTIKY